MMTFQEFVNAYYGYDGTHMSIDVMDLSDEDFDLVSAEYDRYQDKCIKEVVK